MQIEQLKTNTALIDWMLTINNIITADADRDEAINLLEEKISTLNEHPFTVNDAGLLCIVVSE